MSREEITFEDDSIFVVSEHRGNGEFEIFTVWTNPDKTYTTKVYRLTPVDGEMVLTRIGLKLKPNGDGLDITDIN